MAQPFSLPDQNIETMCRLEEEALQKRSLSLKISDAVTKSIGTLTAFILHLVVLGVWITINLGVIPFIPPFDPYPFGLMTMIVSLESVLLGIFILISQNRMIRQADKRAHLDLQVNILTEQEITTVLKMLRRMADHLQVPLDVEERVMQEQAEQTDVVGVMEKLDEKLPE